MDIDSYAARVSTTAGFRTINPACIAASAELEKFSFQYTGVYWFVNFLLVWQKQPTATAAVDFLFTDAIQFVTIYFGNDDNRLATSESA
jgi:hypothetical protein